MAKGIAAVIFGIIIGLFVGSIIINRLVPSDTSNEIYTCPTPELISQHINDFTVWEYQKLPWILVDYRSYPTTEASSTDINYVFDYATTVRENELTCNYIGVDPNNIKFSATVSVNLNYKTTVKIDGGKWLRQSEWFSSIAFFKPANDLTPICLTHQVSSCPFRLKELK